MTIKNINVEDTIKQVQEAMNKDKSLSPALRNLINVLILVIQLLFEKIGMNSSNSSLPPSKDKTKDSTDDNKKKKKRKSNKKPGGQPGHKGITLSQYEDPDEIIELSIDKRTLPSGVKFVVGEPEKRQVIDLIVDFKVTEFQAEVMIGDDDSRYVASFPSHIKKAIQYGPSVKSLAVYMNQYQLIPYNRVKETFKDQFGLDISVGSLYNFAREAYELLAPFELNMLAKLKNVGVLCADETGIKINNTLHWLHVLSTDNLTLYYPHKKRGQDAIKEIDVIPDYKGVLCHDHWKPYLSFKCVHALCNAHHLRELQWVIEFKEQKWASTLRKFLIKLKNEVQESGGILPIKIQKKREKRYREIIKKGKGECPMILPTKGSGKKKVAQTKERNLLDRLDKYEEQTLLFMKVKEVPFTNNQAERDIRMVKVHQKISGQFKSMKGAKYFSRIRSFLMTNKKQGHSPFDKLTEIFESQVELR